MSEISQRIAALSPEQQALLQSRLKQKSLKLPKKLQISQRTTSDALPLSPAQERLWVLHQLQPNLPLYNESFLFRLSGQLDSIVLEKSLNEIIQRHEILRTSIVVTEGQPSQIIASSKTINLPIVDLQELPDQQEAQAKQIANHSSSQPFDLAEAPLLRVLLLRLKQTEHIMLLTMHHIISDGWSWGILFQELTTLYQAYIAGNSSPLSELPIQYADFALWQQQQLQAPELETQLAYWQQQLKNAPPVVELPTDFLRPAIERYQGARTAFVLPQHLTNQLKSVCKRERVTLFVLLLAAFKTLLYRYNSSEDILVATPVANRTQIETESLIGCFINTLVLRTDFSGNLSFRELLLRVQEVELAAQAHQDLPFAQLVKALQPERNLSYSPLFQIMFVFQQAPVLALDLPNLKLQPLLVDSGVAKFDLTLFVEDNYQGLTGAIEYNTDLFKAETIARMLGHFQTLLESIVTGLDRRLSDLQLLTAAERHQLLVEWNHTEINYLQNQCLHELFAAQVEKTPDAVAVVFADEQLTYRQLDQHANAVAHHLQQLGIKPDMLVGICLERSLLMVVGLLGVLKAGAAYVPLDPTYPSERLAFMLSDSQAKVLLTQQHLLETLPPYQAKVICLDSVDITTNSAVAPTTKVSPLDLAYTIYTSGSTGKPKGVQISHSAVVNFLQSMQRQLGLTASDILLSVTTISFDIAALELYLPLITGAKVVLVSREAASDGKLLNEQLADASATVMQATPATWRMLLAAGWQGSQQLKILCGGEALPRDLAKQLLEKGAIVWNLYGPTETTIWSTAYAVKDSELATGFVPIGRPIANTQIYLLDSQQQPVPIGVPGELYIGGAGVARGYLNRPDLTDKKFVLHASGNRLYKTGDLARYLPNGNIEYLGRLDQQVKIRGFRIELGEIEAVLRQHPAVLSTIVMAMARTDVADSPRLVAYIVLCSQPVPSISEWRGFLKHYLPDYMIPSAFVILEALPLTPNGKVDRRALPAPDTAQPEVDEAIATPRTLQEQVLAKIWCQVLRIEQVGIHDNFFDLGGDSILSVLITSRADQAGLQLTTKQLFQNQTIAELAAVAIQTISQPLHQSETLQSPPQHKAKGYTPANFPLAKLDQQQLDRLITSNLDDIYPLSPVQQGLLFHTLSAPNSGIYFMQMSCTLHGELNVSAFKQSWQIAIARHSILRTAFIWEDLEQPLQVVLQNVELPWQSYDWRELSPNQQLAQLEAWLPTERSQGFTLSQAPLMRITLIHLAENTYQFTWSSHHLLLDGWSIPLVIKEVFTIYLALCQGKKISLTPSRPYRDYIAWLQQQDLSPAAAFWRQLLQGFTTPTPLGMNQAAKKASQDGSYHIQTITLSAATTAALQSVAQKQRLTLNTLIQGTWALLLHHYSNQQDVVFGATSSGRPTDLAGVEFIVGLLISTLPVRVQVSPTEFLLPWLQQIQLQQIEARQYEYSPLARVQKWSDCPPSVSLFESLVVFENYPTDSSLLRWGDNLEMHNVRVAIDNGYPLTIRVLPGKELSLQMLYDCCRFETATIVQKLGHFEILLSRIAENPHIQLGELKQILAETDKQQQLIKQKELEEASLQKLKMTKRKSLRSKE